jgi:hypothetical protein
MWSTIAAIILDFLSKFFNGLIDNERKLDKIEELGKAEAQLENIEVISKKDDAAKKELEKPILRGRELINDLRRKNKANIANTANTHTS